MKRRVVLRADASKSVGFGHFYRTLALANHLKEEYDCYFASHNAGDNIGFFSAQQYSDINQVCTPLHVPGPALGVYNEEFLSELESTDIVVLDNYYFSTDYQRKIKSKGCKLVCIDDMHDRHMVSDVLISPCPHDRGNYSIEPYTIVKEGLEWIFLREPFLQRLHHRTETSRIRHAVLAMGGTDAFNLTDKMIKVFHAVLPETVINVIAGTTLNLSDESRSLCTIHSNLSAEEMVRLFDSSDIGIFPACTISIEALSRGLCVIAGYYVDNQEELYEYGVRKKYYTGIGDLLEDSETLKQRLKMVIDYSRPKPMPIDFSKQKAMVLQLFKELN